MTLTNDKVSVLVNYFCVSYPLTHTAHMDFVVMWSKWIIMPLSLKCSKSPVCFCLREHVLSLNGPFVCRLARKSACNYVLTLYQSISLIVVVIASWEISLRSGVITSEPSRFALTNWDLVWKILLLWSIHCCSWWLRQFRNTVVVGDYILLRAI
jgi:hypothetical protein